MKAEQTVAREISSLQPGEHLCCFSREAQSYLDVRLRYLSAGLELGQKLLYLYHDSDPHTLLASFEVAGLPAWDAQARGQFVLLPASEIYGTTASLDPQATQARLHAAAQQALEEGYPALRVAVEMSWAFPLVRGSKAAEQLMRCEALLTVPGSLPNALLLCLYDRRCADPAFLLDVLTAHPTLLEQGAVYPNPCCLPAEVFLSEHRGEAILDMHLRAIATRRRTEMPFKDGRRRTASRDPAAVDSAAADSALADMLYRQEAEVALASVYAALRESEDRYRTVFEAATEAIFIYDMHGTLLEVNRVACERLGYSVEELLGQKSDFIDAPELAGQAAVRLSLLRQYGAISYETVHLTRSGDLVPVEVNARLIDYAGRQVVLSVARDITDRKRAELSIINVNQALASANEALKLSNQALEVSNAALRTSEHKFRSLVESSPNGISLIDEDGQILQFNPANEAIFGVPAGRVLGKHVVDFFREVLPPDQNSQERRANWARVIAEVLRSGEGDWLYKVHDHEVQSFDGRLRYVQSTGFPIRTERGYMVGLTTRDVTAHRLAERELEEYRQRLEGMVAERTEQLRHEIGERQQVEQNLEVMLREIHHRVKNNLNVMVALIDLQKSAHTDPSVLKTFKELQTRAYTMALVHESLYRSPNLAQVDFSSYLNTLLDYLHSAYGPYDTGGTARLLVAAENVALPIETAIPCGLIVNELVTNALKYAFPAGYAAPQPEGAQVLVRMEAIPGETGSFILTVSDNGAGLPGEVDWQSTATLGLQLVRVLASQLNGQLALLPGPGTCWRLEFKERR